MKKYIETVSDENMDVLIEYFISRDYNKNGDRLPSVTIRSVLINFNMQSEDPCGAVEHGNGFRYTALRISAGTILELAKEIQTLQGSLLPDNAETDC